MELTSTKVMHDPLRSHVTESILKSLKGSGVDTSAITPESIYDALVEPPNRELGDLAFGCFLVAKATKTAPPLIAKQLQQNLVNDQWIESAQAAGPYLNIKFKLEAFFTHVFEPIKTKEYFKRKLTQNAPKTMIEYSQPNTHKELHVGHMRNLCLGDVIVRLLKYAGYPIVTATFPGDMGTHVAKCLWYMKLHNTEPEPATNKGEWLGRMYSKGHIKLEDEENTPLGEKNKAELTAIINQLEKQEGEYHQLWIDTRKWSIELMEQSYKWADVHFDHWYWESEVDADGVALVKKYYADGKLVKSQGAIGMDLESEGLGFCMLIKSDGTGLYATKDLELARRKFNDFKVQKSIYVVDVRQALHFKQVFRTLEHLGFDQAKNCYHLQYNFVELPDGAMSSRKGNIVPLFDLIHQMEQMVKDQYLSRYAEVWKQSEIDETASRIAKGAIKYGMLRIDTNKKIVFDMNEWLKLDGESGPFIQYSYARIKSLESKFLAEVDGLKINFNLLTHKSERYLLQQLSHFNTIVTTAAENFKPNSVCNYLYDLAKAFNGFYHDCPIGTAETEELKVTRLALASATGRALKEGLSLLGIPVPDRM